MFERQEDKNLWKKGPSYCIIKRSGKSNCGSQENQKKSCMMQVWFPLKELSSHSMAKWNPYKSEKIKIKSTTVWKNKVPSFGLHWIKVFYDLNLASQRSNLEILLLSKFWSKRGDFNFHDSQDYKFSCCGSFGLDFFISFRWPCCALNLPKA